MPVKVTLMSLSGQVNMMVDAFTVTRVTGNMKSVNWVKKKHFWEHLKGIKFPVPSKRVIVDMLIGIDYPNLHYSIKDVKGNPGEPIARLTPLGWTCIGKSIEEKVSVWHQSHYTQTYFSQTNGELEKIDSNLKKFWELETVPNCKDNVMKSEDKIALELVEKSISYKSGRYEVCIPWKESPAELPDNISAARKRLQHTERNLVKNPTVREAYRDTIKQYQEKGYITEVPIESTAAGSWFLPHFPVVRMDKETTKTRIVFDAAAKSAGFSLNDIIHRGPKLQRDLFDVLLRFRKNQVAIICDIAEMYLQIEVKKEDRSYLRFLWRDMEMDQPIRCFQFNRLVFGMNSSPFQAQLVSRKNAEIHQTQYPRAAETVLKSTYMDDSMDSVTNDEEGIRLYRELMALWKKAGMHARKWLSNSEQVLQNIKPENRSQMIDLSNDEIPSVKTLGILWIAKDDVFSFSSKQPEENIQLTKRTFLSKIATLFDPLGFLCPFIMRAKVMMQEIWTSGTDWDEPLEMHICDQASKWFGELAHLSEIKIPRCLREMSDELEVEKKLHVFVDASEKAYAAVVYQRIVYQNDNISVTFVASKSKVAPLNAVSIPRLELMGAMLGLSLAISIGQAIDVSVSDMKFWCDSMNVLYWIKKPSRSFKPFVANRVGELHNKTNPSQWRYINTSQNPADIGTRGTSLKELGRNEIWWNGPTFLAMPEVDWPEPKFSEVKWEECSEVKRKNSSLFGQVIEMARSIRDQAWRLNTARFSSWKKLLRIQSWVKRFVNNSRMDKEVRYCGLLTPEEIEETEMDIIKTSQVMAFPQEYEALLKQEEIPKKSKLLCLNPVLDDDGLIRCNGRLKNAEFLPYDVKFPIVLARNSDVTRLIVKEYHELGHHINGTNQTLAQISTKFWIIAAREVIRSWEKECAECRRRKAVAAKQIMAPLPKIRTRFSLRAFSHIGLDFGGPFLTKQGRGKTKAKRYLCLFTCLSSRAVHLEVAFGLDTSSFLNAFYRMVGRRGMPEEIVSDNGTNFVSANKELQDALKGVSVQKLQDETSHHGVKWYFNPPLSPHFGGVFESMIKAAKLAINAKLKDADISDEELISIVTGAESLINSRPITYQSSNPKDDCPLTPNHFLHGQIGGNFAPEVGRQIYYNPKKRWRRVQQIIQHFWERWMTEYIPSLNSRKIWHTRRRNLNVGEIVLVISPDTPRGKWPLGRIVEVLKGSDGNVRVVKVKVGGNVYTRSISKLCPLEIDETS